MKGIRRSIKKVLGDIHAGQRIRKMHVFGEINKISPFKKVLDAGSGGGDYILHLAKKYPDSFFEGVEIDPIQYQKCLTEKQDLKLNNVNFILGDLTEPVDSDKYDFAYSIDVLEHIENDKLALRNIYNALTTGGKFLIHVPLLEEHIFQKIKNMPKQEDHVREGYNIDALLSKLTETGFQIKLMKYTFSRYKGALAWELWKMYPYSTLPIIVILGFLDVNTINKSGGSVLIIAEKR
jgi:SAM-dependent methyltransferase